MAESNIIDGNIPKHVAIIMDGNGRWAKEKGKMRSFGHQQGIQSVRECIEACGDLDISYLTLYAFSTENWKRSQTEINFLLNLLQSAIKEESKKLFENEIRLQTIGDLTPFPKNLINQINEVKKATSKFDRFTLTIALNYGSHQEIINAMKVIGEQIKNNVISPELISEKTIEENLYTKGMPPVDLMIRTSGEQRLSNFLLWQLAYAELYFTPVLWPDFKKKNFFEAIEAYQQRDRRYGKA